jgi:quercetin dioxygenase-like cupin family protein
MSGLDELLPLYALGLLEGDEATQVERALASDPVLARELSELQDASHELSSLTAPITPPADLEKRLLASVGGGRFERFAARFGQIFDISVDRVRELLGLCERESSWAEEAPSVFLIHFGAGPAAATADCGIVRIAAGGTFPPHMHRGEELSIVLAGTLRDLDGTLYRAGDELVYAQGSSHLLTVEGDEDVIFVARAFNGIELQLPPQG